MLLALLAACSAPADPPAVVPTVTEAPVRTRPPAPPVLEPAEALERAEIVFIGRAHPQAAEGLRARVAHLREMNGPPPPSTDAQSYPDRFPVQMEVMDTLVMPEHSIRHPDLPAHVHWGLATDSYFGSTSGLATYDDAVYADLEAVLSKPWVVVLMFGIYIDRGNSAPSIRDAFGDYGTDFTMPNRGFDTEAEARAWFEALKNGG